MKRLTLDLLWFGFGLAILVLPACNPTAPDVSQIAAGSGIRVWLDQPPDEADLPLAPYTLRAHARDSAGGGVQQVTFLVNKIPLGTISTDSTQSLVAAEFNWNPSVPGEYTVQAQAAGPSGTGSSEIAVICVGPTCVQAATSSPTVAAPQPTGCKGMPVIASFTASAASIPAGGSSTLSWSVSNADKVEMLGVGDVPATGTSSVSPSVTTTYTLDALCGGKETMVVQSVTVTVTGGKGCSGMPVVSFTASPTSITAGGSSTLRWTITNADQVILWDGSAVGLTGSRAVSPRTTTAYGIAALCGGKQNLVERSVSVNVTAAPGPTRTPTKAPVQPPAPPPQPPQGGCTGTPNISSFTISSEVIPPGGSVTLNWGAVTNADSVSIDQGIGGVGTPGSVTVTPGGPTTYTLTARCGNNVATRQVKMTFSAAQPPPPQDKQGPAISGVSPSAKSVFYNGEGCGPTSFAVSANVTDPSGVKSVQLTYRYLPSKGGASNPNGITMNSIGGNNFSATIDVKKEAYTPLNGGSGQIEFWVVAQDGLGNSSQSSTATVSIDNCPP